MYPDLNSHPNPNPNRNNPNNLLDAIILLGYNVRMGCIICSRENHSLSLTGVDYKLDFWRFGTIFCVNHTDDMKNSTMTEFLYFPYLAKIVNLRRKTTFKTKAKYKNV